MKYKEIKELNYYWVQSKHFHNSAKPYMWTQVQVISKISKRRSIVKVSYTNGTQIHRALANRHMKKDSRVLKTFDKIN